MKNTLVFPLIFVGLWGVACGGDDGARRGNQTAYETVQEGSAAGVTSTIHGPGEVMPPVTGTNADTTTAFSIDPNVASAAPQPNVAPGGGTLAGTLPSQPAYPPPMTSATPQPQQPRSVYVPPSQPRQQTQQPQQPPRSYPVQQPQPQRPVEQERPEPQQPPATDTSATTPQQQQPATNTNPPQQQQSQQPQQPPTTNTNPPAEEEDEEPAEEPPPPPTTTDTRGN